MLGCLVPNLHPRKEGRKVAVSKDWKLIRRENGQDVEIASNVLWYDLDADGHPVYTDGYALYDKSGKSRYKAEELLSCVSSNPADVAAETT